MLILLARLYGRIRPLRPWLAPAVVALFVFVTAWPLLVLTEGAGSPIVAPSNYWWWFVVSATTVGYGDFFPSSAAGHVVGGYVIVGGIVALTTIFTNLAAVLEKARGRRMHGAVTVSASGHTVLLGYTPGRTERIVDQLLAEGGRQVVLVAGDDVTNHPMAEREVEYVRGDLADVDVLERAGVPRARDVLIDVGDDNEALAVAVAVDHANPGAHLVVTLRNMARASHLSYVSQAIRCVQWHSPYLVTEELESPGITEVYADLMRYGGANTYSAVLPEVGEVTFGDCQVALGRELGATILAVRTGSELLVNPTWSTSLAAGVVLYYVHSERL
ncbi:MAG: NAD-binding protein, partial [Micromonosporaceae bacterium]